MTLEPPFPVKAGDTIQYIDKHGYQGGYFVRWNKDGAAVIKKPSGGHVTAAIRNIRPSNDGRMVRLRGFIQYRPAHLDEAPTPKKQVTRGK